VDAATELGVHSSYIDECAPTFSLRG
jgi:hypothetical protein